MSKMTITVHESKMTAAMARAILNGSAEGDKEDARRNLNRLYSEWVVKFKTKDGSPYTMKIVGAEDEDQAWKMALKNADKNGGGDLIDKTAPLNIDYIQKWESKVREANAIPDKTLHTVLANLKCLGKPGKAMQNYPIKRRSEIFAEMEKRGWLEPDSMNLTDKGNEEAKKWVHLCQESKSSMTIKVHGIDEKKYNAKLDTMMDEFKRVLGNKYKFKVLNENPSGGQQLVIGVPGVGEFFCFYELAYTGGKFNVHTWEADASFDKNCDMSLFHELEAIFKKYCEG